MSLDPKVIELFKLAAGYFVIVGGAVAWVFMMNFVLGLFDKKENLPHEG